MIFFDLDMFFPYLDDCSSLDEVALDPTAQEVCQRVLTDLMGRNDLMEPLPGSLSVLLDENEES